MSLDYGGLNSIAYEPLKTEKVLSAEFLVLSWQIAVGSGESGVRSQEMMG